MAYLVGVLVAFVVILASIALHEVGHMLPAKRFGVRVSQYMVGFGPTLWSRTRGETEYGLKAIPLGGYVRLVGMYPTDEAVGAREPRTWFGRLAADARQASAEEIFPGEDHRAFYRLSTPKKLMVMFGGPFMNLLIAMVLMGIAVSGIGIPGPTTTVGAVAECVLTGTQTECDSAAAPGPAQAAGIIAGDVVLSWDGTKTSTWEELSTAIRASSGSVPVVVERDGAQLDLTAQVVRAERPQVDANGQVVTSADGAVEMVEVGYAGIAPLTALQHTPVWQVPGVVANTAWQTAQIVVTLPQRAWQVGVQTATGQERSADTVLSIVGVGRWAGEVASVQGEGIDTALRVAALLQMLALLNVSLFVFNMVPLPPLDGGHIAVALWEGARRRLAKMRGKQAPLPTDSARLVPLAYAVFAVFAVMGAVLVWADLVNPVTLS